MVDRQPADSCTRVFDYEDVPYARHVLVGVGQCRREPGGEDGPAARTMVEARIERRVAVVMTDCSRVTLIFRFLSDSEAAVIEPATRVGLPLEYAERF